MIISHAHKYAFLRTRKTASSSTALYLMQNLFEEGDISIRDLRPQHDHPAPTLYDDTVVQYTLKHVLDSGMIDAETYKIYATLRDPYERIVSRAFYKGGAQNIFEAQAILGKGYVDETDRDNPQSSYIVKGGQIVPTVLDYRNIKAELRAILAAHGKEEKYPLLRLKSGFRPSWATVDAVITPKIREKIDEVFASDVSLWATFNSLG